MFSDAAAHIMLDALSVAQLSLHSAFPGTSGAANELAGGDYARQAPSGYSAAAGRQRTLSAAVPFAGLPAGAVVAWVGRWTTGGATFLGAAPAGGTPREYFVDPATETFTSRNHGLTTGQTVVFYGGSVPGGITEGTIYFVIGATTHTFQVSATEGGSAVDITSEPTEQGLVSRIVVETYAAAGGTCNVNSDVLRLNF